MDVPFGGGVLGVNVIGTVCADPDGLNGGDDCLDEEGDAVKLEGHDPSPALITWLWGSGGERVIMRIRFLCTVTRTEG